MAESVFQLFPAKFIAVAVLPNYAKKWRKKLGIFIDYKSISVFDSSNFIIKYYNSQVR
jgi:hypothetical protein